MFVQSDRFLANWHGVFLDWLFGNNAWFVWRLFLQSLYFGNLLFFNRVLRKLLLRLGFNFIFNVLLITSSSKCIIILLNFIFKLVIIVTTSLTSFLLDFNCCLSFMILSLTIELACHNRRLLEWFFFIGVCSIQLRLFTAGNGWWRLRCHVLLVVLVWADIALDSMRNYYWLAIIIGAITWSALDLERATERLRQSCTILRCSERTISCGWSDRLICFAEDGTVFLVQVFLNVLRRSDEDCTTWLICSITVLLMERANFGCHRCLWGRTSWATT